MMPEMGSEIQNAIMYPFRLDAFLWLHRMKATYLHPYFPFYKELVSGSLSIKLSQLALFVLSRMFQLLTPQDIIEIASYSLLLLLDLEPILVLNKNIYFLYWSE